MTSFWQEAKGGELAGMIAFSQPLSALRLFHVPTFLQSEILFDSASRNTEGMDGVWG